MNSVARFFSRSFYRLLIEINVENNDIIKDKKWRWKIYIGNLVHVPKV
ncbi:hypothetical protein ACNRWW_08300 [Metabacillus sp. HB246100]|nr:hypothetical protein [Bacillus weihaiensis]